jgi:hypothetical protein
VAMLLDGTARDATALERALVGLVRAAHEAPALLTPRDLTPVRAVVGDGALDYVLVLGSFHFINRIADLLGVDPEALPERLRRFEMVRRIGVRIAARLIARMDLANRAYAPTWEAAWERAAPLVERSLGRPAGDALAPLRARPKMLEVLALALAERDERSTLDRGTLARVHRTVEDALPRSLADSTGFHARPKDPVEAFAFVGTRYPARTTPAMVDALRRDGRDDLAVLDLAIAIADANNWARMHRLLELPPELLYVTPP